MVRTEWNVRDADGTVILTKGEAEGGTKLTIEIDHGKLILRKNAREAINRVRGKFSLPDGMTTDDAMRDLRGRAPADPVEP